MRIFCTLIMLISVVGCASKRNHETHLAPEGYLDRPRIDPWTGQKIPSRFWFKAFDPATTRGGHDISTIFAVATDEDTGDVYAYDPISGDSPSLTKEVWRGTGPALVSGGFGVVESNIDGVWGVKQAKEFGRNFGRNRKPDNVSITGGGANVGNVSSNATGGEGGVGQGGSGGNATTDSHNTTTANGGTGNGGHATANGGRSSSTSGSTIRDSGNARSNAEVNNSGNNRIHSNIENQNGQSQQLDNR
jgi:hypothetical protein